MHGETVKFDNWSNFSELYQFSK